MQSKLSDIGLLIHVKRHRRCSATQSML